MAEAGVVGALVGLVGMAIGLLVMYFVVKAAVKNGVLQALDDPRATVGAHRVITHLRGGGAQQQPPPPGPYQQGQYPPR